MTQRVADIVAETLARYGAKRAFGIPGGEVLTLVDALDAAGVKFVLARQETAAAMMCAGSALAHGGPGVLVTTLGPGLASAVNGIADASQEHVPLIVLAGVVDHAVRGRYTHQVIDHRALLRPLVKGCFELESNGAGAVTARALELAMAAPMGPVLLEIAPGTAQQPACNVDQPRSPPVTYRPEFDPSGPTLKLVKERLSSAERPLLIAGWEAARSAGDFSMGRLAERYGMPVITTYKAKGTLDETHPLSLGAAGLSPLADRHLMPLVKSADLVVLAGYDPIEMRQGWLDPFHPEAYVIEISDCAPDHAMHRVSARVEGNVWTILNALLDGNTTRRSPWDNTVAETKQALGTAFAGPNRWGPHEAIEVLEQRITPDTVVTVDSGAHRILLSQKLRLRKPMMLLQSAGFCTMGAALPLAIGFKTMRTDRPVIAVLGDGGLDMGLGELATLREERLPVVVVVFRDESLALIEMKQEQLKLRGAGVRLGRTAYEDIAPACGGFGAAVATRADFERELDAALARDVFSVIVCDIKADDYADRI